MDTQDIIKLSHNRYFEELEGLARVVEILKDGGSPNIMADELSRRIEVFANAIKEFGVMLIRETT